ncbi:MAG: glycosyltransferase 87 family protein [Actinomycetota bacterium]|nr:glycosyltransferase 87 family protein [Actinomycetota bacterium]
MLLILAAAVAVARTHGPPVRVALERTDTWATLFLGLLVLALAFYFGALGLLRSGHNQVALVCVVGALIQLAPLAGPLLVSRDVYSYWAYGRIVAHHRQNPYTVAPARFPDDPATRAAARGWRRQTSVYGPAFTFASAGVSKVVDRSAELASLLFRIGAAGAGIGAMVLAAVIAKRKAYAAAFVGWNPVLAVNFAGGGHNDALMLVLMLAALALVARRRDAAGGALWILAAAIKAPALVLLLPQLLRSRRGVWLGAALAAVTVTVIAIAAFGTSWLAAIWQSNQREAGYGLPSRLEQLGIPEAITHVLAYGVLGVGVLWLARQALRGRPRLALGAALLVLTSPWILPWYSTWPVVLASIEEDLVAQVVALGLLAYLLPDRIPL